MRDFHDRQEQAQYLTWQLCVLLLLGTAVTIASMAIAFSATTVFCSVAYLKYIVHMEVDQEYFWKIFENRCYESLVLSAGIVIVAVVYTAWRVAEGGGRMIATRAGGLQIISTIATPPQKQLLNIVEELSFATGIQAPRVYVLPQESGINAFAAGLTVKDAVIAVTQGALDRLTRDQLQGVVAHEYSHIANGDMRLNARLIGMLTGIQVLAYCATFLLRMAAGRTTQRPGQLGGAHPASQIIALIVGAVLWPIGKIGELFALLIKLAVNRQREFLADAKAVEFTRNPKGLCDALKIIAADVNGGRVRSAGAAKLGHMFFAEGQSVFAQLLRTHPTLQARIARLDPTWDGSLDVALPDTDLLGAEPLEPELAARD